MTKFSLFLVVMLLCLSVESQNLIARHSAGVVTLYTTLYTAYAASLNDDTLYLPGGAYEAPGQFIKRLHIFGAGAKIDSSIATGNTKIFTTGTEIKINTGAAFSSFEGIYFDDPVTIGSSTALDDDLHDIMFKFCDFNFDLKFGVVMPSPVNLITLIDCEIGSLNGQDAENCAFYNCLILSGENNIKNGLFKNSVFMNHVWYNVSTIFENCIFGSSGYPATGYYDTYCSYTNCIITYCCSGVTNTFINTIYCYPLFQFEIGGDGYRLIPGCSGINGGTDGNDVGIYGGIYSWKDGMIPSNPHISFKSISDASNGDGTLDVNIKVNAQDQ